MFEAIAAILFGIVAGYMVWIYIKLCDISIDLQELEHELNRIDLELWKKERG
jgi:xanthine/uracil permease